MQNNIYDYNYPLIFATGAKSKMLLLGIFPTHPLVIRSLLLPSTSGEILDDRG